MTQTPFKILYICTHNRCRSILSEAITRDMAGQQIAARSAGSEPAGAVHPLSLLYLQEAGISTEGLHSKSWNELEDFAPDLVITVCDTAARESCPLYFSSAVVAHWGLADPSKVVGSDADIAAAFRECIRLIRQRVELLTTAVTKGRMNSRAAIRQWLDEHHSV